MGSSSSRNNDPRMAFEDFTVYIADLIEKTSMFLVNSPKIVSDNKRKVMTLNIDVFMALIANTALRLKKLDSAYEDNVDIITMFDAILHTLWTSISRRYPHISRDNNRVSRPKFIAHSEYLETCSWIQQKIVSIIEIICQCSVILGSCKWDDINAMRDPNPQSILSILRTELDVSVEHLEIMALSKGLSAFEKFFYGISLAGFIHPMRILQERLLTFDVETLRKSRIESTSASPSSASSSEAGGYQSLQKRDVAAIISKKILRQSSDQPLRTLLMKNEYAKNASHHQRSASEGHLASIEESPRKEQEKKKKKIPIPTVPSAISHTASNEAAISTITRTRSILTNTPSFSTRKKSVASLTVITPESNDASVTNGTTTPSEDKQASVNNSDSLSKA